ncbi:calcium/sodium antiporter [Brevibacterium sp. 50QC2O2]|uniref:calcium/sodium antiporter n=1 Tax=Brevibacterium TaxID=1696 RepID=UPI00211D07B4|nr:MULTISPECIES: calcium/sodium antiporter [unclassified Brevibacterium]MCQ9384195.1 calcium/sodium antiporter [Brevibacterium sp. 68QC2CO]MCQ9388326.1 calcium/sodium antiporter [Brevibacterium sp. 50QC2O2]
MIAPILSLLIGLIALIGGAELVVRSGSKIASRLGIPPIVIGLTVVSIGTSAPELAVGIDAIHAGTGSLAIGNIAGTNVVNILLLLGLSAALLPLPLDRQTLRLDLPTIVVASLLFWALAADGTLSTFDGAVLFASALAYTALLIVYVRRQRAAGAGPEIAHTEAEVSAGLDARTGPVPLVPAAPGDKAIPTAARTRTTNAGRWYLPGQLVLLAIGLFVIVKGADWLVGGAEELARAAGVSDAFIGLTIVAIGTSAPELATTLLSTIRGERDIAIGNLIGSSTFNLTLVLGVSLLVTPGTVHIDPTLVSLDIPIMVAVAVLCIPVFLTGRRISRTEGFLFIAAYAVYLGFLIATRA